MSLAEEKVLAQVTEEFTNAIKMFQKKMHAAACSGFEQITRDHSSSDYYSVLEVVGRANSYLKIAQNCLASKEERILTREDHVYAALYKLNAGQHQEALDVIELYLSMHEGDAQSFYLRSLVLCHLGQSDKSLASLEKAIKADNGYKTIAYNEPDFEQLQENPAFRSLME